MRHRFHAILIVCAAVALLVAAGPAAADAASRETETVYLDGHTAQINTRSAVVFDASSGLLYHASPVFIVGFRLHSTRPARSRCPSGLGTPALWPCGHPACVSPQAAGLRHE